MSKGREKDIVEGKIKTIKEKRIKEWKGGMRKS